MSRLHTWRKRIRMPVAAKYFSRLQNALTNCESESAFCWMGTGFVSRRWSGQGLKLTALLHIVSSLRMSRSTPVCPIQSFTAWRGKNLHFISNARIYVYVYDFGDRNKSNAIPTIARMCDSDTLTIIIHSAHIHCIVSNKVLKCEVL